MAIFQRKNIWYVDYTIGKGKSRKRIRKAVGIKKTNAINKLAEIRVSKTKNGFYDIKKDYNYTFDELLEKYKDIFSEQKYYCTKKTYFPVYKKYFSGRLLSEITPYHLEKFRNERKATPVKSGIEKVPKGKKIRDILPKFKKERT